MDHGTRCHICTRECHTAKGVILHQDSNHKDYKDGGVLQQALREQGGLGRAQGPTTLASSSSRSVDHLDSTYCKS
ncbi:unnamed protein product [Linum trigynum]|uniref:C2H2-type domain-containing protein n=1 Tax=Linum trigynum TaxID=586398 RepID=A0AAV2D883_9ROSI